MNLCSKKALAVLSGTVLLLNAPLWALGGGAKQVLIEAQIVPVTVVTEQMIYETGTGRDTSSEIAALLKTLPDGSKTLEASVVSFGRGADFRRIETRNPRLVVRPEVSPDTGYVTLIPDIEKIQVIKPSAAAPAAPFLFGAFGAMYEGPGRQAAANPGQACPVTGKSTGESGERGGMSQAIDKAGMAAGMALLSSQAKGELDGLKLKWTLSSQLSYKFDLRYETFNKNTKQTENITQTLSFDPPAQSVAQEAGKAAIRSYGFEDFDVFKDLKIRTGAQVTIDGSKIKFDVTTDVTGEGWAPNKVQIFAGDDKDYKHHWDDFDEHGYCYDCDFYEPYADERNYDEDGYYMGPPPVRVLKISESILNIEGPNQRLKTVFLSDIPVVRTLFKTELKNERTGQLLVFVRPAILNPVENVE